MEFNEISLLLRRYSEGKCTEEESALVDRWWQQLIETGDCPLSDEEKQRLGQLMQHRLHQRIDAEEHATRQATVVALWKRWSLAASILLVVGLAGIYFLLHKQTFNSKQVAVVNQSNDVLPPGASKAVIVLSNGQRMYLDSLKNGQSAIQGNSRLVKLANGKFSYQALGNTKDQGNSILYNTIFNPNGSKTIAMTLSDDSRVWLNAGSSMTYPVAFAGDARKVSVSGEAYFEIASDANRPFYVSKGNMQVKVLGTHFNVNAYDDEKSIKVTLLAGSVRVSLSSPGGNSITLAPSQQAVIHPGTQIAKRDVADPADAIAWKNNLFSFQDKSIDEILHDIGRWYDLKIVYEGGPPNIKLAGAMSRDIKLSGALLGLKDLGMRFRLDGKKLIVLPSGR